MKHIDLVVSFLTLVRLQVELSEFWKSEFRDTFVGELAALRQIEKL